MTDQGRLQYDHPSGVCLVAAGRGTTIPLKETLDLPDPTWLQFRRRFDKVEPFCRIAGHTSEEVRDILATLETVYQQLFPQLNLRQWAGTIYTPLPHSVLDPTASSRVAMDNLMKLVTTALEWTYEAQDTEVGAKWLKSAAELLVLRHNTLWIIDGVGPDAPVEDRDAETKDRANGKEPELQTVEAKRAAEHDENGGNGERTGANEHITQMYVFSNGGSHRSQTMGGKFRHLGGMS